MRSQIANSLKKRCKAIRNAVNAYNKTADAFDPPRPHVNWQKVAKYEFIEEFELLKNTRNDVAEKEFTEPAAREMIKIWRRVVRAREEVTRCEVEARRLHTSIRDEAILFNRILSEMDHDDPLYGAVEGYCTRRGRINARLLLRIQQIYAVPIFTGTKGPGTRLGGSPNPISTASAPASAPSAAGPSTAASDTALNTALDTGIINTPEVPIDELADDSGDEEDDEEVQQSMDMMSDWTGRLAT